MSQTRLLGVGRPTLVPKFPLIYLQELASSVEKQHLHLEREGFIICLGIDIHSRSHFVPSGNAQQKDIKHSVKLISRPIHQTTHCCQDTILRSGEQRHQPAPNDWLWT